MTDRLVLAIDGSNWLHRAWHVGTGTNHGAIVFCDMLTKVERTFGPSHTYVAFDHDAPTWRHKLLPTYKGDRAAKDVSLVKDLELAEQAARAFGCQVFKVPGFEADDILATIATRSSKAGLRTMVASSDKDLLQLVGENVRGLNAKYELVSAADVAERWGVGPDKLRDVLALMGDPTDCIPGVEGIGAITAATLVREYGSALGAVERAAEVGGKRGATLGSAKATVELCLALVALRTDVDIGPLKATPLNHQALAVFREKLANPPTSLTVTCYGVCKGDPKFRTADGYLCSLCGGSGKVTTYNQRLVEAKEWDSVTHREVS